MRNGEKLKVCPTLMVEELSSHFSLGSCCANIMWAYGYKSKFPLESSPKTFKDLKTDLALARSPEHVSPTPRIPEAGVTGRLSVMYQLL